jgi:ABC-2 type transport system ATP-binding protein
VNHLVKKYGDHLAVDDISFTVEQGKVYGFLGPNGAGKSTTMNMITGYIASTQGEIIINGHNILEEPEEAKKSIGYLPEQPPLYVDMKVMEYLKFSGELKKIPKAKMGQMIQEVMELVDIQDKQDRLIKNLSKGYKQRVGLAQAILGYPEIIILDEPTVGLDPKQIIEIRDLIKGLSEKHTVILSSHILSEVSAVCDYVLIISGGKLVASDTPQNLSKFAAGSNILDIKVKSTVEDMKKVLGNISEIQECTFEESEEGAVNVTIKTEDSMDIREQIFYLCAKEKCPIIEMKLKTLSLEDVFLELTQGSEVTEELKSEDSEDSKDDEERQSLADEAKQDCDDQQNNDGEVSES